jgi:hypothetical protein
MTPRHLALGLLLISQLALAQTTYRWVDQDGRVHFSDRPPPPSAQVKEAKEKELPSLGAPAPVMSYAMRKAAADFPLTLYVSPECGAPCMNGIKYLRDRKLPFSQKDVKSNEDIEAFKKATGADEPTVPTLMVGTRVLKGFQAESWKDLIDLAGYPAQ